MFTQKLFALVTGNMFCICQECNRAKTLTAIAQGRSKAGSNDIEKKSALWNWTHFLAVGPISKAFGAEKIQR